MYGRKLVLHAEAAINLLLLLCPSVSFEVVLLYMFPPLMDIDCASLVDESRSNITIWPFSLISLSSHGWLNYTSNVIWEMCVS